MDFQTHIEIDYSGADTPSSRLPNLQVYEAKLATEPIPVMTPAAPHGQRWNWCRAEVADWLLAQARSGQRFVAGIDHGFSFPATYFGRYGLADWPSFLNDFCRHWPTERSGVSVESVRAAGPGRVGQADEFRLTETWTSSAKSVFLFDVQGQVAKSTHAGIPWLRTIRQQVGGLVHFWPFDGWQVPAGKSLIVEVYPSIFRNRYPRHERTADQHDAYAIARWLAESDRRKILEPYFTPPLTDTERAVAEIEGWILGVC